MSMKKVVGILLLAMLALSVVCYAASRRWYCPNCGSRLEYKTPVEYVSPQDEERVGPCYDMTGNPRAHNWRPM